MNGRCLNLVGGYRCLCNLGYQPSRQGKACAGTRIKLFKLCLLEGFTFTSEVSDLDQPGAFAILGFDVTACI